MTLIFLPNCATCNKKKKIVLEVVTARKQTNTHTFWLLYPETFLALHKTALLHPLPTGFILSYSELISSTQTRSLTPSRSHSHLKAVASIIHKDNHKYAESCRHVMERLTCIRSKFHALHGAYDFPINSCSMDKLPFSATPTVPKQGQLQNRFSCSRIKFYFFGRMEIKQVYYAPFSWVLHVDACVHAHCLLPAHREGTNHGHALKQYSGN